MPSPLPNVKAVFDHALEIESPVDREAYLDAACAGAPDVRQKVEALLRAYVEAGSFLEPPSPNPTDATGTFGALSLAESETGAHCPDGATGTFSDGPRTERSAGLAAGTTIAGRYTLVEMIGEGGMGSVYLASQTEPVKRQVALKLIKTGMDSKAVLARFDADRQALALMDHPNIARIYDGGLTPTGQRVLTGSEDNTARVWDLTGQEKLVLNGHTDRVTCAALGADGQRILTGSHDGTARIWDAATGQEKIILKGHIASVYSVAFSPDGQRVLTGSANCTARVWDAVTGQEKIVLEGHTGAIMSVAFSSDGKRVITGSDDGTARIWDATAEPEK